MGAVILTCAFLASPLVLRCEWRLFIAVPLSVVQLFPPVIAISSYHPPIALLGALSLWPEGLAKLKTLLRWPPTTILIALAVLFAASSLWSSDLRAVARHIVYLAAFLGIFAGVISISRQQSETVTRLLDATIILGLIQALLVLLFKLAPAMEQVFWHTELAHILMNPNRVTSMFNGQGNNAFAANKSGGLLVNANVAGAYLWILSMAALGLAGKRGGLWRYAIAVFCLAASMITGSKAEFLLGFAFTPLVLILATVDYFRHQIWSILGLAMLAAGLAGPIIQPYASAAIKGFIPKTRAAASNSHSIKSSTKTPAIKCHGSINNSHCSVKKTNGSAYKKSTREKSIVNRSISSLKTRLLIWQYGAEQFTKHPFLGLGSGGWKTSFPSYAQKEHLNPTFPPHDTLIDLWSRTGILGAILGLAFMVSVAVFTIRWYFGASRGTDRAIALATPAAFAATFIHGLVTNFGLLGETHMAPVLATLLGLSFALNRFDRNIV